MIELRDMNAPSDSSLVEKSTWSPRADVKPDSSPSNEHIAIARVSCVGRPVLRGHLFDAYDCEDGRPPESSRSYSESGHSRPAFRLYDARLIRFCFLLYCITENNCIFTFVATSRSQLRRFFVLN